MVSNNRKIEVGWGVGGSRVAEGGRGISLTFDLEIKG